LSKKARLIQELSKIKNKMSSIEQSYSAIMTDMDGGQPPAPQQQLQNQISAQRPQSQLGQTLDYTSNPNRLSRSPLDGDFNSGNYGSVVEMHFSKYIKVETQDLFAKNHQTEIKKVHQDEILEVYKKMEDMNITNQELLMHIESLKGRVKEYQFEIVGKSKESQELCKVISDFESREKGWAES
jgi:hypothetical protein